jgi:hypothetical protein
MQETDSCERAGVASGYNCQRTSGRLLELPHSADWWREAKNLQNRLRLLTIALSGPGLSAFHRALAIHVQERAYENFTRKLLYKREQLYLMTSKNSLWARFH